MLLLMEAVSIMYLSFTRLKISITFFTASTKTHQNVLEILLVGQVPAIPTLLYVYNEQLRLKGELDTGIDQRSKCLLDLAIVHV